MSISLSSGSTHLDGCLYDRLGDRRLIRPRRRSDVFYFVKVRWFGRAYTWEHSSTSCDRCDSVKNTQHATREFAPRSSSLISASMLSRFTCPGICGCRSVRTVNSMPAMARSASPLSSPVVTPPV
jgi:hypothetical protein